MELQYAPPAKSPTRVVPVILAGVLTTALTLLGVYLVDKNQSTNIMGWHANYVIPAGAILVGLFASSGYGLASYLTGLKIRKGLLWSILLLQILAYFAAQYVSFASQGPLFLRSTGRQVTFPEYFDLVARSFAWKPEHSYDNKQEEPLGAWGYFFVGLEILGFAGGSLVLPGALMMHPYCELCQVYMKRKTLATIPASVRARKVNKKDAAAMEAYTAEHKAAYEVGRTKLNELPKRAEAGDVAGFRQQVDELAPASKSAGKLPARIVVSLVRCRGCSSGYLDSKLLTGQGKQLKTTQWNPFHLSPDFVAAYTHPFGAVSRTSVATTGNV